MASNEGVLEVEQFVNGSLYKWFKTCIDRFDLKLNNAQDLTYELLIDGVHMHCLFRTMKIPTIKQSFYMYPIDENQRYANLKAIMKNIRNVLEIDLELVILREPNIERLIKEPKLNVREMENLLFLLFTCVESRIDYDMLSKVLKKFDSQNCIEINKCSRKVIPRPEFVFDINMIKDFENSQEIVSRIVDSMREMRDELNIYREFEYNQNPYGRSSIYEVAQRSASEETEVNNHSQPEQGRIPLEKLNNCEDRLKVAFRKLKACKRACRKSMKAVADSKKLINAGVANLDDKNQSINDKTKKKLPTPAVNTWVTCDNQTRLRNCIAASRGNSMIQNISATQRLLGRSYNAQLRDQNNPRQSSIAESSSEATKPPEDFLVYGTSDKKAEPALDGKQFSRTSHNFVDYVRARETNAKEIPEINQETGLRHILSNDLLKENTINLNKSDKVFCSKWLTDRKVVMGTKCNKLMVYDVGTQKLDQIPLLNGRKKQINGSNGMFEETFGIRSVQINPSRNLLATGGKNNAEIAVYKLPTLDPLCVGEQGHTDLVYDMCWIDDQFLVSGARDTKMCLWKINDDLSEVPLTAGFPSHSFVQPVASKICQSAEKLRSLILNKSFNEIAVLSMNSYVHIWSSDTFVQKMSRKLSQCTENVCIALKDVSMYAIGCRSNTLLLDTRTLQEINRVHTSYGECGIRSVSFEGSILTVATGLGRILFYDIRAQKYLESSIDSKSVTLKASKGYMRPHVDFIDGFNNVNYSPAIFTHCYDASGTRLFCGGGPLPINLYGNYAAIWQ